ncbi:MAG: heterocyst frequency control protein PatD [Leptolyngbyaceae cyanobacterium]
MYQRLQQKLQKIQDSVQADLDRLVTEGHPQEDSMVARNGVGISPPGGKQAPSPQDLLQAFAEVRQLWVQLQAQPQSHSRWQSLCTEIHKQLRLAEMDVQFWAAARQSKTALRRGQQLCDRLSTLINYCDAGIKLNQQSSSEANADMLP